MDKGGSTVFITMHVFEKVKLASPHLHTVMYASFSPFLERGAQVLGAAVDDDLVKETASIVGFVAGEVAKTAKKEKTAKKGNN